MPSHPSRRATSPRLELTMKEKLSKLVPKMQPVNRSFTSGRFVGGKGSGINTYVPILDEYVIVCCGALTNNVVKFFDALIVDGAETRHFLADDVRDATAFEDPAIAKALAAFLNENERQYAGFAPFTAHALVERGPDDPIELGEPLV
jgi:hypothetical protein